MTQKMTTPSERNKSANHERFLKEVLLYISKGLPNWRVWKNNTGVGRAINNDRIIRFGLKGSADIIGITDKGIFLAIEIKTGKARQNKDQKNFEKMIKKQGGLYFLVRDNKEISEQIC